MNVKGVKSFHLNYCRIYFYLFFYSFSRKTRSFSTCTLPTLLVHLIHLLFILLSSNDQQQQQKTFLLCTKTLKWKWYFLVYTFKFYLLLFLSILKWISWKRQKLQSFSILNNSFDSKEFIFDFFIIREWKIK